MCIQSCYSTSHICPVYELPAPAAAASPEGTTAAGTASAEAAASESPSPSAAAAEHGAQNAHNDSQDEAIEESLINP